MKKSHVLLFLCIAIIAACNTPEKTDKHTKSDKNINFNICYKQKVNGYAVSATIITDSLYEEFHSDITQREAVLSFKKDNQEFTIFNPLYADKNLIGKLAALKNGETIQIDYIPFHVSDDNRFSGNQSPFFFFDVDFDGEEELIVCLWEGMAYHGHHSYQAFKINTGDINHRLSPMTGNPFDELDDYSEFDAVNKTICIPTDVDIKIGGRKKYCLSETSFELKEVIKYDWEHTKGIKYTPCDPTIYYYKVIDGEEILDRIEKCPRDR